MFPVLAGVLSRKATFLPMLRKNGTLWSLVVGSASQNLAQRHVIEPRCTLLKRAHFWQGC